MTPRRHRHLAAVRVCSGMAAPVNTGTVVYFVCCRFKNGEAAWVERDAARCDRASTLADLRSGELSDVAMIIETEFTPHGLNGRMHSREVTEDMLAEAEQIRQQDREPAMSAFDRLLADIDHAIDERKHWSVS